MNIDVVPIPQQPVPAARVEPGSIVRRHYSSDNGIPRTQVQTPCMLARRDCATIDDPDKFEYFLIEMRTGTIFDCTPDRLLIPYRSATLTIEQ